MNRRFEKCGKFEILTFYISDILREFNPRLTGVSHGMGTREQLPEHQLSVAVSNATSSNMPEQVLEIFRFDSEKK